MPSPFPGMNPYLEHPDVWHDFHKTFIFAVSETLVSQVRPDFIVKIDQHVYIHDLTTSEPAFIGRSDVRIAHRGDIDAGSTVALATLAAPTWATLAVEFDEEKVSFLEIRDREDRALIAVIELLSPVNKRFGADRDAFITKRKRYLGSGVHYIEIDLMRGQPRMPLGIDLDCDYYAMVSRWELRPRAGIWPIRLRDPLPTIPVPLRGEHPGAKLDLQAALHRVYDATGYEDYIYVNSPIPPLNAEDAGWAEGLIGKLA